MCLRSCLASQGSVRYLVFRKERLAERPTQRASRDALYVILAQRASRDALGTFLKKSIFFFSRTFLIFRRKKRLFPRKTMKSRFFPQFSRFFRQKKRPAHLKSVSGSVPRKQRPGALPEFSQINFPQKVTRRSIGRSLRKIR